MIDPISYNPIQQRNKSKGLIVVVFVVIITAVIGGIFLFRQPPKKIEQKKETVVENKEPTPTEKPKIDKKSVKIQVLNGTGTPGQAGTAVEDLKKAGYDSDNIKTANAEEFNSSVTSIAAKSDFEDIASDIKDALKTTFNEIKIDSANLDGDNEFDIVVTTGGKKFGEASPTPSPTTEATATPTPTLTSTPSPSPTP